MSNECSSGGIPGRPRRKGHQELHRLQQKEVSAMLHDEINPEQPMPLAVERPSGPGIMVFSSSAKVQYTNAAACHFLKRLNQKKRGRARNGALPVALEQLVDKVRQVLEGRPVDKDPRQ